MTPKNSRINRLRNRLILVFLTATLIPLGATIWITTSLLDWSLNFSTTDELEKLSRTSNGPATSSTSASTTS